MIRTAALVWTVAITAACLMPGGDIPRWQFLPFSTDKVVHLVLFLGYGALWAQVVPRRTVAVAVSGVALGVAIEILQGLLPLGRSMDPLDALADVVGLAVGIGLTRWTRRVA